MLSYNQTSILYCTALVVTCANWRGTGHRTRRGVGMGRDDICVGIIGAMDIEVDLIKRMFEGTREVRRFGMVFCVGSLGGVSAVAVECGCGKVNAALCAMLLVSEFGVTHVINTGVAGALDDRIDIGDVVVSVDAVQHDMDCTALGYDPGCIPGLDEIEFEADRDLRKLAVRAVEQEAPEVHVFEGRVASGDQFVSSKEQRDFIDSVFGALCTEMEGGAIAHACHLAEVPFVVVRAISDKADGSADMDYPTFKNVAAARSARIVARIIKDM